MELERVDEQEVVPTHHHLMVDNSVQEEVLKPTSAQVHLVLYLLNGLHGSRGVLVPSHVVPDNLHERELASIHKTLDNPAQDEAPKQGAARLT